MTQLAIFVFGVFVSTIVFASFAVLTWSAVETDEGLALGPRQPDTTS